MDVRIRPERLTETFCRLVEIDSPSYGEAAMAAALREKLEALGFSVEPCGCPEGGTTPNLYARLPGVGEPVLLCAHMDTVEPSRGKKARVEPDGTIRSAGNTVLGADDLAAVASILEAVTALREQGIPHRPVELLLSAAEEAYCIGASCFDFSRVTAKEAYVPDMDAPMGYAAVSAPAMFDFTVTVHGRASHAGFAPEQGVSAICTAAQAIGELPNGRVDSRTTLNFGTISGGTATNIVPERCTVTGELRSFDEPFARELLERVENTFRQAAAARGARVEFEKRCLFHTYSVPDSAPSVRNYSRACRELGLEPVFTRTFGGSDNNWLTYHGIPGIVIASAMHNCHTCDEFTTQKELTQCAKILASLLCG